MKIISYQLGKYATSSGSNYEEAQAAVSRIDFGYKVNISLKEMREKFNPFIKFRATRTVPAAATKSIGLAADPAFGEGRRAGALFFARHRDYFIVTRNFTVIYLDLVPFNSFIVTRSSLPSTGRDSYRDGKKLVTATLRYRSGQAPTSPN